VASVEALRIQTRSCKRKVEVRWAGASNVNLDLDLDFDVGVGRLRGVTCLSEMSIALLSR
jgi:hypothetical protein